MINKLEDMLNILKDIDDSDESEEDLEYEPISLDEFKKNIPQYTSQKLCELIAINRCFGSYKEQSIICMEELAARRIAGDDYNFEDYIDKAFGELPKLDFAIPDLRDVLRQVISGRNK
jgi:hypothetical protein